MRVRTLALVLTVAAVGLLAIDALGPLANPIRPGSVGVAPQTEMQMLAFDPAWDDASCSGAMPDGEDCARRYAFEPGAELTAWTSVRNEGPVGVTLDGSSDWLAEFDDVTPLAKPVALLDGGDIHDGVPAVVGVPLATIAIAPGAERLIGVRFRTLDDVTYACEHWADGAAITWDELRLTWHWLLVRHDVVVAFERPVSFHAPTAADCPVGG